MLKYLLSVKYVAMKRKRVYKKTFVYDLDDTLYFCAHDYYPPTSEFIQYMLDTFNEKISYWTYVAELEGKIDRERVEKLGFKKARFPGSLKETYYRLCDTFGVVPDDQVADRCYKIGLKAFNKENYFKKGLMKGAEEMLKLHKKNNDKLVLCTKGENDIQKTKIETLSLEKYFTKNRQFIVANKNKLLYERIKEKFPAEKMYVVGNSLASDILPAVEAGFKGIYVPVITWEYEKQANRNLEVPQEVRILKSLEELVDIYPEL